MEQIRELEKLKDKLSTIDNLVKQVEENNHYFNDIIDSKKELDILAKETTALIEKDREEILQILKKSNEASIEELRATNNKINTNYQSIQNLITSVQNVDTKLDARFQNMSNTIIEIDKKVERNYNSLMHQTSEIKIIKGELETLKEANELIQKSSRSNFIVLMIILILVVILLLQNFLV